METNLKSNLSTLSTIPESVLNKLISEMVYCICDNVEETILNDELISEIDIGIGTLLINIENNTIRYKFRPSQQLENGLTDVVLNGKNNLVSALEKSLVDKMINTYKNFL